MSNKFNPEAPGVMDVHGAAAYIGCAVQTLHTRRHKGNGPSSVKHGRRVYYRAADLDKWLANRAPPEGMVDVREAGKILGLSAEWLCHLRGKARGPKFKIIGHRIYYRLDDLHSFKKVRDNFAKAREALRKEMPQRRAAA